MRGSRRQWFRLGGAWATSHLPVWASAVHLDTAAPRRLHTMTWPVPEVPPACPGVKELDAMCDRLASQGVVVNVIGHSRGGQPIRCVSVSTGGKFNALLVGTPHPNEPIGGRTIEVMLGLLQRRAPDLWELPFNWHFIPTIDPDGLALNESWLSSPHDARGYFQGSFRPAFRHQAEYAFPLHARRYAFDAVTPETRAWMAAIDEFKPQLMVSLHNAEHGGAFNVLSGPHPALALGLSAQARRHGIALDEAGDPYAEQQVLAPGVFLAEDFRALVDHAPAGSWTAGDSSFGYAARHGTFGLVPEVPLWQEAEGGAQPASTDPWDATLQGLYERSVALVARLRRAPNSHAEADLLLAAVLEGEDTLRRLMKMQSLPPSRSMTAKVARLNRRRLHLLPLRTLGLLSRWCEKQRSTSTTVEDRRMLQGLGDEAAQLMEQQWADGSLASGMVPVPLQAAVMTQLQAILSTALAVAENGHAASRGDGVGAASRDAKPNKHK